MRGESGRRAHAMTPDEIPVEGRVHAFLRPISARTLREILTCAVRIDLSH
jgi:hypothetical protein